MKYISLKYRMMLLAMLPTLLVSVAISGFAIYETQNFGQLNNSAFRDQMLELRRNELLSYTLLAESAIDAYYNNSILPPYEAQEAAKDVIRKLNYGPSGYFFINDYQGKTLVHGAKPALEGRDLWDLKSKDDKYLIRDFDRAAKDGTGFTQYMWDKPGFADPVDKLGYVKTLDKWDWIIGTGLYIDDIEAVHMKLNRALDDNLSQSVWIFLGLSGTALLLAVLLFGRLTLKQGDSTDHKLKALSEQVNRAQEHERQAIAAEIDDSVEEHLVGLRDRLPGLLVDKGVSTEVTEILTQEVAKAVKAIQKISHTLNPKSLEEYGLAYGLDILCKQYNDRGRVPVKLYQQGELSQRLPLNVEWEIYRTVQDVMRFVEQSEGDGKIVLRSSFAEDSVQISLLEDMVGFDPKSNDKSGSDMAALLLNTVISRIEGVGGEVSAFGTKGTGTLLKIKIDLANESVELQPALAS
ncbi:cache domain-containing protein [Sedimenticola sp.]|uniref:cache domain-containing protein n=1 Tax=Sedimenticola sp. TaxID=1940285 RepID=UPI00258D611B|nr:cache domain-containing protein [Sedimenticola sp.]MCW8904576.1 cache domain-containing protein [Sedimenticola sp.]